MVRLRKGTVMTHDARRGIRQDWVVLGAVGILLATAGDAHAVIDLNVQRGLGPEAVTLRWEGARAPYSVYRSSSPSAVVAAGNLAAQVADQEWTEDSPVPSGSALFYQVEGSGCGHDSECAPTSTCSAAGICERVRRCTPPVLGQCHPYLVSQQEIVNVVHYGANGDDGVSIPADDTDAFEQAIQAIPSNTGGVILVPAGQYVISRPLVIDKAAPVHLLGVGSTGSPLGSVLFWLGPANTPLIRLVGLSNSWVEGVGIAVLDPYQLAVAIQVETKTGRASTQNTFKEIYLASQTSQLVDGFRFVAGDDVGANGEDQGNDCHCFERVSVTNFRGSAFRFMHPSSGEHLFSSSQFAGTGYLPATGRAGVSTVPAPGRIGGGGFAWIGGGGGLCDVANFELAEPNSAVTIEGFNSEVSRHTLVSVGPSPGYQVPPVEYRSGRYETIVQNNDPLIVYHHSGRLSVQGNIFAYLGDGTIQMHPPAPASMVVANNSFFDLVGEPSGLDFTVIDVSTNVTALRYGNAFGHYIGSTYFTDHEPSPIAPAALPNPTPPGPIPTHGPPLPHDAELLMTTSVYPVSAFGAVANDLIDDTLAFQLAIDAAQGHHSGGIVHIPAGSYRISDSLIVGSTRVIKFRGDGSANSILEWHGPGDRPMLLLDAQRDSVFGYFSIRIGSSQQLHTGIATKTHDDFPPPRIPTNLAFYDVVIDGFGRLDYGFRIHPGRRPTGEANDYNNEFHYFVGCSVRGYRIAGYSIEHAQAKTHTFLNSRFEGSQIGLYGVATRFGLQSGSFRWIGGGGGENTAADFGLGGADDFILIRDGVFARSKRFLESNFATSQWNINLWRNHWTTPAALLAADNRIIDHNYAGPLVLEGNVFEITGLVPSTARTSHTSWFPTAMTAIGNEFRWPGSDLSPRLVTVGPASGIGTFERTLRGNIYWDVASTLLVRPTEP